MNGVSNLLAPLPPDLREEVCQTLLTTPGLRLERIVSKGQASPPGFWYDQDWHEWVMVLTGEAGLVFADAPGEMRLSPGDHVFIPAHRRHRVAWTDPETPTVWLALHFAGELPETAAEGRKP